MLSTIFVGKYYAINPRSERVLPDGRSLKKDMIVLVDAIDLRENTCRELNSRQFKKASEMNRWCKIVEILRVDEFWISFRARYADNTEIVRKIDVGFPWIVKIDSIQEF